MISAPDAILGAHVLASAMMAGIVWFVQVVHYPLMGRLSPEQGPGYARAHTARTTLIVGPLMLVELVSALWIAFDPRLDFESVQAPWRWINIALIALCWIVTFGVSVPCHQRLEKAQSHRTLRVLVLTNWMRVILWSLHMVLAAYILVSC